MTKPSLTYAERIKRYPWTHHRQTELQRRTQRAVILLRRDGTIHPADALAMVVWPPKEVSCSDS